MSALIFTLSMPGVNSWNGRWTGEEKVYEIIMPIRRTKVHLAKCEKIVADGPYSYAFGDGWRASVDARIEHDTAKIRQARRKTAGFCGYDWMVESIYWDGFIQSNSDKRNAKSEGSAKP
jgi:hypothetical protein